MLSPHPDGRGVGLVLYCLGKNNLFPLLKCLAYTHCNEHQANDSMNHSLPSLSSGSEINRILD